jgi:hypothetical protein
MPDFGEDHEHVLTDAAGYVTRWEAFAGGMQERNPEWRMGQTYFNTLHMTHREWADEIHGTDLDTFYRDERIPAFREWLTNKFKQYEDSP